MKCIFCCVFFQEKYVDMFYLLLESIFIYGNLDDNTNILVYTSTNFMNTIKQSHLFNAEKVKLTGKKYADKTYYWHTGHPGGIKERTARQIMEGKFPERILEESVSRMISRGPLQRDIMVKLHLYCGAEHKHQGQNPQVLDIASMNRKNKKTN